MIHVPTSQEFLDIDGEEREYLADPELGHLADVIFRKHEVKFEHLANVNITFLWKGEGGSSGGKATLGRTEKMSGLKRYFAKCDFVIWLASDHCRARRFEPPQLEALLFHELCHIGVEETEKGTKYVILPHDLDVFLAEIHEYGLWTDDLKRLRQLPLFAAVALAIPHTERHPNIVQGCAECLTELGDELVRQRAEAEDREGTVTVHIGPDEDARLAAAARLRAAGVFFDDTTGEIVREPSEPHLHRRQSTKYPTPVCTDPECSLEPKYPVEEAEQALAGAG